MHRHYFHFFFAFLAFKSIFDQSSLELVLVDNLTKVKEQEFELFFKGAIYKCRHAIKREENM